MLNRDFEIVICSSFVNCALRSCDMNSTLGSVVPLAMFFHELCVCDDSPVKKISGFVVFPSIQLVVKGFPNILLCCVPREGTMFVQCLPFVLCSVEWCALFIFKAFKSLRSPGEEPPRRSSRAFPYL